MAIPESVWQSSEQWQRITGCPRPLWCDFHVAETAIKCSYSVWKHMVSFVTHYQATPDGDKEAVSKGHTPLTAIWVGKPSLVCHALKFY